MERVFELEEESKMILKIKGGEYNIEPPPSIQLASYLNAADKYAKNEIGAGDFFVEVNKHLHNLGLPKEVVKSLTANQQAKVLEFVYENGQKKKLAKYEFMFAKMVRYYGFGHEELMVMPCNWFMTYYKAITTLEAQEELLGIQRNMMPHMKESSRKRVHKKYSELAYDHEEKEFISPTELAKQLGAING